MKYPRANL